MSSHPITFPFADRTCWDLTPNRLTQLKEKLLSQGTHVLDLTESNPTKVGLRYPQELLSFLSDPRSLEYEPSPMGLLESRKAVSSIYAAKGVSVPTEQILLTASTSEAYSFLFRLLANPGDEILVPKPSYPLFEYLMGLHDLNAVSYPLIYSGQWTLDLDALSRAMTQRTKAVIAVHPNNPTGSCFTREELQDLRALLRERKVPLIADEVFAEYLGTLYNGRVSPSRTLAGDQETLTFSLGGLSKWMGLPQMKLAWIAATGPSELLRKALERLEVIADTFLSVSTPIQHAFPRWMGIAPLIQDQIRARLSGNRQLLEKRLASHRAVEFLQADGGWNAVLRVPSLKDEEGFVLRLLEEKRLLIHPGYFFDFKEPGFLVISLLVPPESLEKGLISLEGCL
jgi:hypothetical protein